MEIEIKIEPYSSSMSYYCIYHRPKKKFNLFNSWNILVEVWDGVYLTYDQPVLIPDFDAAVKFGARLKEQPTLIKEHYDMEDKKYLAAEKRRRDNYYSRNKRTIL